MYNYINQYDREVYIEGESEQQLKVVNTVDITNDIDNNIIKYTVVSKTDSTIEFDSATITDTYFPIEEVDILDYEIEKDNGISIRVATYDKNYSYILILDDNRISVIDRIMIDDIGYFILYFKNCYYKTSIKLNKCELIVSSIGTVFAENNGNSISVGDISYGNKRAVSLVNECGMYVKRLAYNNQCVDISNNTIINTKDLPLEIAIVDYKKNNIYNSTNYDNYIYVSNNMFLLSVINILEIITAEEDLQAYIATKYPAVIWNMSLLTIDGKIYPIGTKCPVKNNGKIRKIRLYNISNVEKEFDITVKTFKVNGVPSTFMLNKYANVLDVQTYTKSVSDATSEISTSKLYLKNIVKNKMYSYGVDVPDSDSNRTIENILKNRYKIISRRCDSYVLW